MNDLAAAKTLAQRYWAACDRADAAALSALVADGVTWDGPWPVKSAGSGAELCATWAKPLLAGFSGGLRRQFHILTAGYSEAHEDGAKDGRLWVAGTGFLHGHQDGEVFSIPPTNRDLHLRWGEFLCIENGQIVEGQVILDFVDWFEQIGRPVLTPNAVPGVWPPPTAFDGVDLSGATKADTQDTLAFGRDFIFGGLNGFDQDALASMGMADYFHPNVKWYGPGGIGACLSFAEFETRHQAVWLEAFPDRKVKHLSSLFAEGRVLSASGPMGVVATQTGPYLGAVPSGNRVEISGLDFWLRTGRQFTENWVFVDMIKLFDQMGVDLFARMKGMT